MIPLTTYDPRFLRLLELSPFEKRTRGGYRFGTKTISDRVVDRMIESGCAVREGKWLLLRAQAVARLGVR